MKEKKEGSFGMGDGKGLILCRKGSDGDGSS